MDAFRCPDKKLMCDMVRSYARQAVVRRLELLADLDDESQCFEEMPVREILANSELLDSIADGLVGAWDLDLNEAEHVDNEIAFWIEARK